MNPLRFLLKVIVAFLLPQHKAPILPLNDLLGVVANFIFDLPNNATSPTPIKPTEDTIRHCGYPLEFHEIISDDGYVLTLHRIPRSKNSTPTNKKPPIVFVPGILADSSGFVVRGEKLSPAFIFSDAGYDVWLLNNRGTRYSRKHTFLDPDTEKGFWNFSFHEMGVHDMPAVVNYVLHTSNATELYLCGHSMGGGIISVFLAENPLLSHKVKAAFLMSPAIKLGRTRFPLVHNARFIIYAALSIFNDMEILPSSDNLTIVVEHLCNQPLIKPFSNLIDYYLSAGIESGDIKVLTVLDLVKNHVGTSVKIVHHYLQMISKKDFSQFDYGSEGNLVAYGNSKPPQYNLSAIRAPVWIFYSDDDKLIDSTDMSEVSVEFTNLKGLIRVKTEFMLNPHLGFTLSTHVKRLYCDRMLNDMSVLEAADYSSLPNDDIALSYLFFLTLIALTLLLLILSCVRTFRKHDVGRRPQPSVSSMPEV